MADRPFEDSHTAHRPTEHRSPTGHAEVGRQPGLDGDLVAHGDERKPTPPPPTVRRQRSWPGRALTATKNIRRDDEPALGSERAPRADQAVPPARRWMRAV